MKRKIASVVPYDEDADEIIIILDNRNEIMLELKLMLPNPLFAKIIEERLLPQTDGERIYWQNGASLTLEEIITMVRTDNNSET